MVAAKDILLTEKELGVDLANENHAKNDYDVSDFYMILLNESFNFE